MQAIVIAHNQEEREFLSYVLRHSGLSVARTGAVKLILNSLHANPVDLFLFAPGDVVTLAADVQVVREFSQAPLLALVDPVAEDTHCALLDAGVDLVLIRPLSPRLLSRYVKIFLQRAGSLPLSILTPIDIEGLSLDPGTHTVRLPDGNRQHLTPLEFRLLYILMANPEQIIPAEVIVERVWGYSAEGNRELVRGLVRRLRRKIEVNATSSHYIHTHPGIGYRFSVSNQLSL